MSMVIINKNNGRKIDVTVSGTKIYFGDDELMLNAARYQRDFPVHVDVCMNNDHQLVLGTWEGMYYVAEVDIPAKQYTEPEQPADPMQGGDPPALIPLSMDDVTCTLWSLDNPTPIPAAVG